jgi:hypothetical protein
MLKLKLLTSKNLVNIGKQVFHVDKITFLSKKSFKLAMVGFV